MYYLECNSQTGGYLMRFIVVVELHHIYLGKLILDLTDALWELCLGFKLTPRKGLGSSSNRNVYTAIFSFVVHPSQLTQALKLAVTGCVGVVLFCCCRAIIPFMDTSQGQSKSALGFSLPFKFRAQHTLCSDFGGTDFIKRSPA